jgi:hypothetical protein
MTTLNRPYLKPRRAALSSDDVILVDGPKGLGTTTPAVLANRLTELGLLSAPTPDPDPTPTFARIIEANASLSVSHDGLTVSRGTSAGGLYTQARAGLAVTSGRYYFEVKIGGTAWGTNPPSVGLLLASTPLGEDWLGNLPGQFLMAVDGGVYSVTGTAYKIGDWGAAVDPNDWIGCAFDVNTGHLYARNITKNSAWNKSGSVDPAAGTGGLPFPVGDPVSVACQFVDVGGPVTFNFGATPYLGAAPTGFGNWPPAPVVEAKRSVLGWIDAEDYVVLDGDGQPDDAATIQAAIDAAYHNQVQTVYLKPRDWVTTRPIYLDPPGNLRSSLTDPTIFSFSLALVGEGGLGNHESFGTRIRPVDNSFVAVWVGPGQGMLVDGVQIIPTSRQGAGRKAYPSTGVGIAIAGGNGGASRSKIENCWIEGYHVGIATGHNHDFLGDSNTISKTVVSECYVGVDFQQSQNYINSLYECNITDCILAVRSALGKPVNIFGGNYSTVSALRTKATISGVSALSGYSTDLTGNALTNYRFTATVASPSAAMIAGLYDIACVKTPGFGVVPLVFESFNAGTSTATFALQKMWRAWTFGATVDVTAVTDLQAELQAATTLYAAEWVRTFSGVGFKVHGAHIENPDVVTCVVSHDTGTLGDRANVFDGLFFNWAISQETNATATDDKLGLFYLQQCFPFIEHLKATALTVSNWTTSQKPWSEGVIIDSAAGDRMIFSNNDFVAPNVRHFANAPPVSGYYGDAVTKGRGAGEWDVSPFLPRGGAIDMTDRLWRGPSGGGVCPTIGQRPAPWALPRLTPAHVDALAPAPSNLDVVPLMHADAIYSVSDWDSGAQRYAFAKRAGAFYSYGADLTLSWSYKGATGIVSLSDTGRMFAGLEIILNDGSDDQYYIVTGVYPALGYVTVTQAFDYTTTHVTSGTKTVTYTGATVKQQRLRVVKYGRQCEFAAALTDLTGRTFSRDDIIYKTSATAGASPGWLCTTAGVVGSGGWL